MATHIPTTEPVTLIAGDTAQWCITLPNYPASEGWALFYTLITSAEHYTFGSVPSGDAHLVTVAASTTANWAPDRYTWRCQAKKDAEVFTVGSGRLTLQGPFTDSDEASDIRSHARKTLDAVEAYLENPNNLTSAMYEIAGRKLQRLSIPDLLTLRSRYQAEVAREEAAALVGRGLPDRRRVFVRFGP